MDELPQPIRAIADMRREIEALAAARDAALAETNQLIAECEKLATERSQIAGEHASIVAECDVLSAEIEALKREIAAATADLENLRRFPSWGRLPSPRRLSALLSQRFHAKR